MGDATKRSAVVPLAAHRAGTGEPLLLIHGFTLNWQSWGGVIDELSADFDVLTPTLPGHWGGPESDRPLTIAGFADFLERRMDDAGWADAHVAGTRSVAGWPRSWLASARPFATMSLSRPGLISVNAAPAAISAATAESTRAHLLI
ncbi:alpha/beta fold hydrolase [Nocardia sp. CA-084685]|uniref:alpha/beta fold hydrolase n=1 Tax=Nocardia sp. CA-084685 TaxID=3239970 RepID=UPI003D960C10